MVKQGLMVQVDDLSYLLNSISLGLLSSFGELQHALSSKPEIKPFEPETTVIQEYSR